jgi:hypothetical protein
VDTEQQDQQWRHQRAAAHTGHSDKQADAESRGYIERVNHIGGRVSGSIRHYQVPSTTM